MVLFNSSSSRNGDKKLELKIKVHKKIQQDATMYQNFIIPYLYEAFCAFYKYGIIQF
jgi:hypothetical protein